MRFVLPPMNPVANAMPMHPMPIPGGSVSLWPATPVPSGSTSIPTTSHCHLENVLGLSKQDIDVVLRESNSRKNFEVRLMKKSLTKEQRKTSNCHGKRRTAWILSG